MKLGDFCDTKLICYRNNSNQRPSDPRVLWFLSLNCLSPRTLSTLCWAETLSILSPEAISLQALFKGQRSQCFLCPKFYLPHFTQTRMDNSFAIRLLIPLDELCWNIMVTYICTALYNLKFQMFDVISTLLNRYCWLHFTYERGYITSLQSQDLNSGVLAPSPMCCYSPSSLLRPQTLCPPWPWFPPCASLYHLSPQSYGLPINPIKGQKYRHGALGFGGGGSRKSKIRFHLPFPSQCKLGWRWEWGELFFL